ncbi:MAG: DUF3822 family protein [Lentimicrobiaceae bacterium]|jgi:hypothetical protein|nr:DUF3822 family protein [Lentimicrobiaceae bacterium]MBT3454034.1 DUF3822 family protein [Lentimicrobiaceae bacterium]MBT3819152.1 DUF3822 family protein [Lentimicrobiaceae bacterium]MBT4060581.1 DUF3822 family protein [Lentimicrobiaceae bacterium]MBT4189635.1 DUF3822 family protein [Lentimicrobiaceae bacterium]
MALQLNPYFSYFDKSFTESQTRNYILLLQLNVHGVELLIYNRERNKFIGAECFIFSEIDTVSQIPSYLGKILNYRPSFAYPYNEVILLYQSRYSTLIPKPLFSEKNKKEYLDFNQPYQEDCRIIVDNLKNNDAVNIYYIPHLIAEKTKELWPNAKILHFSTALIESLSISFKNKIEPKPLFVNIQNDCFDLVYFKENVLHYHNTFEYRTKEDFIYFLLITIDQLGLNPEDVNVHIMGNIDKTDHKYRMLVQYIKNFRFIERNDNFLYSYSLDELQSHKHFTLFNALQCE